MFANELKYHIDRYDEMVVDKSYLELHTEVSNAPYARQMTLIEINRKELYKTDSYFDLGWSETMIEYFGLKKDTATNLPERAA